MFKLIGNYEIDRRVLKCELIRYSPAEVSTKNTPNSQKQAKLPRKDSVISLLNSYLEIVFEFIKKLIMIDMEMVMI